MMSLEMMMAVVEGLGADAEMWLSDGVLHVDLQDFEGFDDDWSEVEREYDDEEAVGAFLEMLEAECFSSEGDYYKDYQFDGFVVRLGYASFEI